MKILVNTPSSDGPVGVASGFRARLVDRGPRGNTAVDGAAMVLLHGMPVDADVRDSLGRWFTPEDGAQPDGVAATARRWLQGAGVDRWSDAYEMISTFDDLDVLTGDFVPDDDVGAVPEAVAVPHEPGRRGHAVRHLPRTASASGGDRA